MNNSDNRSWWCSRGSTGSLFLSLCRVPYEGGKTPKGSLGEVGRIGVGCFVIVGTIYEPEFSKRPWKGGFTSPSCVHTAQIQVTVQPLCLPPFPNNSQPPASTELVVVVVCTGFVRKIRSSFVIVDDFLYRAGDGSRSRRKGGEKDCMRGGIALCDGRAIHPAKGVEAGETGRVRYQGLARIALFVANVLFLYCTSVNNETTQSFPPI